MEVDDFLAHHGVKGMRWGHHKSEVKNPKPSLYRQQQNRKLMMMTVKTKHGVDVSVTEDRGSAFSNFIMTHTKSGRDMLKNTKSFSLSVDGKKVGNASFETRPNGELYLNWLGVAKTQRGKGYGTAVFDAAVKYGRKVGADRLTLEVPGSSPDARHIYEKQGFKAIEKVSDDGDVWGGLTAMQLDLKSHSLKHGELEDADELERALIMTFPQFEDVKHSDLDDFLAHHGVKGMRWGRRKARPQAVDRARQQRRLSTGKKVAIGILAGVGAVAVGVAVVEGRKYAREVTQIRNLHRVMSAVNDPSTRISQRNFQEFQAFMDLGRRGGNLPSGRTNHPHIEKLISKHYGTQKFIQ